MSSYIPAMVLPATPTNAFLLIGDGFTIGVDVDSTCHLLFPCRSSCRHPPFASTRILASHKGVDNRELLACGVKGSMLMVWIADVLIQPQFGWLDQPFGAKSKSKHNACQIVLLVVVVVLLISGWCHYLTCVPTSSWKCDS
ncbi:hypothetical protein GUJ93_ZPchr0014g46635 [Zizania palustris]|uniref:Uncharacterized protein n=1 Tax=Zizania palustris TaxID=103762 RepID=A0A8J5T8P8_ZIZPA|nr:hypothetical protein GUJ93_ZPchr0014g46635 [Zizania palustris]